MLGLQSEGNETFYLDETNVHLFLRRTCSWKTNRYAGGDSDERNTVGQSRDETLSSVYRLEGFGSWKIIEEKMARVIAFDLYNPFSS